MKLPRSRKLPPSQKLRRTSWGTGRPGREAEDIVHQENQGAIFIFREFAFGVAKGLECSAGFGAGFTVLLKLKGLPAGAGEGVEEASEGGGVPAELVIEGTGAEIAQGIEDVEGAEMQGTLVDLRGVAILHQVGGGFPARTPLGQPVLLDEPILVAPLFPFRKVVGFEVAGGIAQALNNFRIGNPVEHHLI